MVRILEYKILAAETSAILVFVRSSEEDLISTSNPVLVKPLAAENAVVPVAVKAVAL